MKMNKILLILIIGIISLNLIFASKVSKTFLIRGDLSVTPDLMSACVSGTETGESPYIDSVQIDTYVVGSGALSSSNSVNSGNVLNLFFVGAPSAKCKLEIYTPNDLTNPIYSQTGLNSTGLKSILNAGKVIGPININSIADTVNFVIKIKTGATAYSTTLLTTSVVVPNPNAENSHILADEAITVNSASSLINLSSSVCNIAKNGKVSVIGGILKMCSCPYADACTGWVNFSSSGLSFSNFEPNQFINYYNPGAMQGTPPVIRIKNGAIGFQQLNSNIADTINLFVSKIYLIDQHETEINFLNDALTNLEQVVLDNKLNSGNNINIDQANNINVVYSAIDENKAAQTTGWAYVKVKDVSGADYWIEAYPSAANITFGLSTDAGNPRLYFVKQKGAYLRFVDPSGNTFNQTASALCAWEVKTKCGGSWDYSWSYIPGFDAYTYANCGGGSGIINFTSYINTACTGNSDYTTRYKSEFQFRLRIKDNTSAVAKTSEIGPIVVYQDIGAIIPSAKLITNTTTTKYYCINNTVDPAVVQLDKISYSTWFYLDNAKVKNTQFSNGYAGNSAYKTWSYALFSTDGVDPVGSATTLVKSQQNFWNFPLPIPTSSVNTYREYINQDGRTESELITGYAFSSYKAYIKNTYGITLHMNTTPGENYGNLITDHLRVKILKIGEPGLPSDSQLELTPNTILNSSPDSINKITSINTGQMCN